MRLRDIFNIPDGEKITDKTFSRVLISSVCGILLCMGCLVGTTWAWFVAGAENTGNVIEIATVTAEVTVCQDDVETPPADDGSYTLAAGTYEVSLQVTNNATSSQRTTYVLVTVTRDDVSTDYYLTFESGQTDAAITVEITGSPATVRFATRWAQPTAEPLTGTVVTVGKNIAE